MSELWHVSEDPTIELFAPHHRELHALDEPLVWAVDTAYLPLYWFPRDCPRALFCATEDTSDDDVERWLDGDRTRRVDVIESAWLERMRAASVYAYRLPPETFEPWDHFFISRETVVPLEVVELGDLLARHAAGRHRAAHRAVALSALGRGDRDDARLQRHPAAKRGAAVRILVAEDETIIRLDLRELLERAGLRGRAPRRRTARRRSSSRGARSPTSRSWT